MSLLVELLSFALLLFGAISALYMVRETVRHPPAMMIMRYVWPLCALFAGPLLIWFYHRYGRKGAEDTPFAARVAKGALHCGAGCALADIICENLAHYVPGTLKYFGLGMLFSVAHELAGRDVWLYGAGAFHPVPSSVRCED